MSVIKLYNPNDMPFGRLSNHSLSYLNINNRVYNTVTNYILSNMLNTPLYRQIIENAPITQPVKNTDIETKVKAIIERTEQRQQRVISPEEKLTIRNQVLLDVKINRMDIYKLYDYYLGLEYQDVVQKSLADGYIARLSGSKREEIIKMLLQSGDAPIEYISNNNLLGMGEDKKGTNLVGKWFMQLRQNIRISQREQERQKQKDTLANNLFTIYQAYAILSSELDRNNDLSEYIGLSASDIVSTYKGSLLKQIPDSLKSTIVQRYNMGLFPFFNSELQSPGFLVNYMRKEYLRNMAEKMKEQQLNQIVQYYVEYVIRQNNMELTDEQVEKGAQQILLVSPDNASYFQLRNKIVELYNQHKFPQAVQTRIEHTIVNSNIPTYDDIKEAESKDLLQSVEKQEESTRKNFFLRQLQSLGIDKPKYKDYDLTKLEQTVQKYGSKAPQDTGYWVYRLTPSGRYIHRSKTPLTLREVENIIQEHNQQTGEYISLNNLNIQWINIPMEEKKEEEYKAPSGKPLEITQDHLLSPLYNDPFVINNWTYPNVSLYLTVVLIMNSGVSFTKRDGMVIYKKFTPLSEVHKMLWRNNKPISANEASAIYIQYRDNTYKELLTKLSNQALNEKFKDTSLQELLLMTGNSHLIWNDKQDTHLGIPTNTVGTQLETIRAKLKTTKPTYKPLTDSAVTQFILTDVFMKSWMEMRVKDMCQVIIRLQKYLEKVGNIKQDIDSRFARIILDNVYQPCSALFSLAKKQKLRMPDYFIKWVEDNDIVNVHLSKDYAKEREIIVNQLNELTEEYYPSKLSITYKGVEPLEKFLKRQSDQLVEFKTKNPSVEDLENFLAKQKQEFMDYSKIEAPTVVDPASDLAKQQLRQWFKFLKRVFKPHMSPEEIRQRLEQSDANYKQTLDKTVSSMDRALLTSKYNEERQNLVNNLLQPHILVEQGTEAFHKEFETIRERFDKEWKTISNISDIRLTKDQIAQYNEEVQTITLQLAKLNREKQAEQLYFQYKVQEIAHVIWDRLAVMIQALIQALPDPTTHNIKLILAKAELLNSGDAKCAVTIPDEKDNCTVSAILNLLMGIEKFKHEYAEDIKLDKPDVDLAVSILLNRNIQIKQDKEVEIEEEDEEKEEKGGVTFLSGEDLALEEEMPPEELEAEEENLWENEEELIEELREDFSLTDKAIEEIKIRLRKLDSSKLGTDIDELSAYISSMAERVKEYQMSPVIKTNRINFFATLL